MPCSSDMMAYERPDVLKKELDEVTNYLCQLCKRAETSIDVDINGIKGLTKWWASHKMADTKRKEALAKQVKAKLSDDELEALGVTR